MDVFSRLMMDRIIFLGVPIYDDAANIIQAQMLFLESTEPEKDIQIYINSPGGSVTAGLGIYDTMQLISSDVATICTGLAASMGAVLLTASARANASPSHSRVMIHQPLGGIEGQASDIEIAAKQILRTKPRFSRSYRFTLQHRHQKDRERCRPRLLDDSTRSERVRPDRRSARQTG